MATASRVPCCVRVCSWALSAVLSAVSALALVSVCAKAPGRSWALLGRAPVSRSWALGAGR
ncbi:hypothetical protein J4T94_gp055 [Mycobacterium phage Krypton555]|uniref:Uncharacterized protein n=1 Tax=Mycobacterium phage Krypton555 TaxID=2015885 RepID=A0A222ZSQ7_9CAUD|nr:hypothetical protein J4T94_gp055 [Mycobacterium phage Krypton555]ASR87161.1 hypothetical protein KRYPTON555_137 [Mycobacterium phage Krypton555]